jgi:hypothetical protein
MKKQILIVIFDDESGEIFYHVPEMAVSAYKIYYRKIGIALNELSVYLINKLWPHFITQQKRFHVIPKNDIIDHNTTGYECPCCPKINVISGEVLHVAMDPGIAAWKDNPDMWVTEKERSVG